MKNKIERQILTSEKWIVRMTQYIDKIKSNLQYEEKHLKKLSKLLKEKDKAKKASQTKGK